MKVSFFVFLVSFNLLATSVFMRENENGKHIMLMEDNRLHQITKSSHWHLYPDLSNDKRLLSYIEINGEDESFLVLNSRLENEKIYWSHEIKGLHIHPKFSRNNKFLFLSLPNSLGSNSIAYLEVDQLMKNEQIKVNYINPDEHAYFPRPSSDASFVVYQRNRDDFKREIVFYDRILDQKLIIDEGMSPSLSFDERLIAYSKKIGEFWQVFVYDRFDKTIKRKTYTNYDVMAPSFDEFNTLYYSAKIKDYFQIYRHQDDQVDAYVMSEKSDDYALQFVSSNNYQQKIMAQIPGEPRSSFGTVEHRGKVYMAGGHKGAEHTYPPESFCDDFVAYDIKTNTWKELAPRPRKAHGYRILAHGDYIYAFGGFAYNESTRPRWRSLDEVDRYDIRTNTWTTVAQMPRARSSNIAVKLFDKAYLVGGWDSTPRYENDLEGHFHDVIDVFDFETQTFTSLDHKLPLPKRRAFSAVVYKEKIILVGGLGIGASHFELIDHVTELDVITGEVKELARLPFATFAPAVGVIKDKLYVFGGMFKTSERSYEYVSHIYEMDIINNNWKHSGHYLSENKGFSEVISIAADTLMILGGHQYRLNEDGPVATTETFSTK